MLKNTLINREAVKKIAQALGELNDQVIYVGGAVVSLYIDDPGAEDVRPTKDIDITLEIQNLGELENLREKLIEKGFYQSSEDKVVCRFSYEDLKVDVMSTTPVGWAPADPWFKAGFKFANSFDVGGIQIKILPLCYFLATKFSAFYDRGGIDPRTSHDFEDIVYLLNYTSYLRNDLQKSDPEVQYFLVEEFKKILNDDRLQEAILGNLFYQDRLFRFNRIIKDLESMVKNY